MESEIELPKGNVRKPVNPFAYSLGEFGLSIAGNVLGLLSLFFYTDVMGLSASLASLARTINAVWDGINDPIFGYLSDRNRYRWGRKPWLLAATPLFLLANFFFWRPPANLSQPQLFSYYLTLLLLFETTATIGWVNYNSLFPDMFRGEKQRTKVNAIRKGIGVVALIVGTAAAPTLYGRLGFAAMGVIFTGIAAVALITFLIIVREERHSTEAYNQTAEKESESKTLGLIESFKATLTNKPYLRYVVVYALFVFAQMVLGAGIPFYTKYSLNLDEAGTSLLFLAVFAIGLPAVFLWVWLQQRIGSRKAWIGSLGIFLLGIIPFGFVTNLTQAMIAGIFVGVGMNGNAVMGDVILGQIIDQDAKVMGVRREGLFYSVLPIPARLSTVLSSLVFALLTPLFGYISGEQPGAQPDVAFRYYMTVLPVVALLAAILVARGYQEQQTKQNENPINSD
ncbi:MAG: MFS transporter [Anaerolineaceae bacterium]|jgi:GPH family glycoside/pentoside/hexuronide:cation symporter|nr:MFS transporter [Anaerolineaceae bacterium]MBP9676929.1 MFS transporter [Anaerolineaceae bacterium]